jgi:hypothetical protein
MRLLSLLLLLLPAIRAGQIDEARLGYVYDPGAGALRPIRGVPGAALVDGAIDPGFTAVRAFAAPAGDVALAVSAADGSVWRIDLRRAAASPVAGAMAQPDAILFSPSGAAGLLYSAAGGRMQVVTGMGGQASAADVATGAAGVPLAIADDGAAVVAATADGAAIYFPDNSSPAVLLPAPAVTASFRRGAHDALAATASGDIYLFETSTGQWRQVYTGDVHTRNPAGVQFAPGGAAWAASAGGDISTIDLAGGGSQTVSCGCAPTAFEPLSGSVYRLTGASDPLLWIWDATQATPAVRFVPRGVDQ